MQKTSDHYAVIFSSQRTTMDDVGYEAMAAEMVALAEKQEGYLGIDSVRGADGFGITVSYWQTLDHIKAWRQHEDHMLAQKYGRDKWYRYFKIRICKVEREYQWPKM